MSNYCKTNKEQVFGIPKKSSVSMQFPCNIVELLILNEFLAIFGVVAIPKYVFHYLHPYTN